MLITWRHSKGHGGGVVDKTNSVQGRELILGMDCARKKDRCRTRKNFPMRSLSTEFSSSWDGETPALEVAKERFDGCLLGLMPKDPDLGLIELVAFKFISRQHSITLNLANPKIDAQRLAGWTLNLTNRASVYMVHMATVHQCLVLSYFHICRGVEVLFLEVMLTI